MRSTERIHAIDTLRCVAAVIVIFWHYQFFFNAKPLTSLFGPFYAGGQAIIDVLFVISGFCIALYHSSQRGNIRLRDPLFRRVAHLLPLQLVTFGATAILFYVLRLKTGIYGSFYLNNDAYHAALNLLLLQYVGLQHGYSFNGPSWLISVEFWVSVPLVLTFFIKSDFGRSALWIVASIASTTILIMFGPAWSGGPKLWGWLEPNLLRCLCGMCIGFLTCRIWLLRQVSPATALAALATGALCSIILMSQGARGAHSMAIGAAMSFVCAPLVVYGCAASPALETIGNSAAGRWFGSIGYSILMWHFPVAQALVLSGCETMPYSSSWLPFVYFALVFSVATASHKAIEIPALKWIANLAGRHSSSIVRSAA